MKNGLLGIAGRLREWVRRVTFRPRTSFVDAEDEVRYLLDTVANGPVVDSAMARFRLAQIAEARGHLDQAAGYYQKLIDDGFALPEVLDGLSSVYRRQGRTKDAAELEQRARRMKRGCAGHLQS